jgi:hypothetical protein
MRHTDFGLGYHLVLYPSDHRIIAAEPATRRVVVRTILEIARAFALLAVGMPDTHLHLAALCDRLAAGDLARRVGAALRRRLRLPLPFAAREPKPLESPDHQRRSFHYIQGQSKHHELGRRWDPFCEATNVPDLIGARLVGGYTIDNVRRTFPRMHSPQYHQRLGMKPLPPWQGEPPEALAHLREATLRAACLPELAGGSEERRAARSAALAVAGPELSQAELIEMLGISRTTAYRDGQRPADAALAHAIRKQLTWSQRVMADRGAHGDRGDGPMTTKGVR